MNHSKIPVSSVSTDDSRSNNDIPAIVSPMHEELGLSHMWVHEQGEGMEVSIKNEAPTSPVHISLRDSPNYIFSCPETSEEVCSTIVTPPKAFCSPFMSFEAIADLLLFNKSPQRTGCPSQIKKASPNKESSKGKCEINSPFLISSCGQYKVNDESPSKFLPFRCGIADCCFEDNTALSPEAAKQRRCMELGIGNMLGSMNTSTNYTLCCGTWQMWSLSCSGQSNLSPDMKPEQIARVLRNRAGNLNSQARRLRKLQNNLMHIQQQNKNGLKVEVALKMNRSFDERLRYSLLDDYVQMKRLATIDATPCSSVTGTTVSGSSDLDLSNLNSGSEYGKFFSVDIPERERENQDLYYDSDPGEFCKVRTYKAKTKQDSTLLHNAMDLAETKSSTMITRKKSYNQADPERFDLDIGDLRQINMLIQVRIFKY